MLTLDRLKSRLSYDPLTGAFTWLVSPSSHVKAGTQAGYIHSSGYIFIGIDTNKHYRAHRLAWFYMTGMWPQHEIDHRNGVRHDNRWENLRIATSAEQRQNMVKRRDNTSGYLGVTFDKDRGRWKAQINCNGEHIYLGRYDSRDEAYRAYLDAKAKVHTFNPIPRGERQWQAY